MDTTLLYFIAYIVGTATGVYIGKEYGIKRGIEWGTNLTIDHLVTKRYIKTKMVDGQEMLVKHDEI